MTVQEINYIRGQKQSSESSVIVLDRRYFSLFNPRSTWTTGWVTLMVNILYYFPDAKTEIKLLFYVIFA